MFIGRMNYKKILLTDYWQNISIMKMKEIDKILYKIATYTKMGKN